MVKRVQIQLAVGSLIHPQLSQRGCEHLGDSPNRNSDPWLTYPFAKYCILAKLPA